MTVMSGDAVPATLPRLRNLNDGLIAILPVWKMSPALHLRMNQENPDWMIIILLLIVSLEASRTRSCVVFD